MHSEERRESYRFVDLSKAACNLIDGDDRIQGALNNLSRTGFFIEAEKQPDISKTYGIEIILQ